jgi:hypothetical protein
LEVVSLKREHQAFEEKLVLDLSRRLFQISGRKLCAVNQREERPREEVLREY